MQFTYQLQNTVLQMVQKQFVVNNHTQKSVVFIHACVYTLETKKLIFFSVSVVIYNKLLLNYLWRCVLKLISELHDFI